MSDEPTFGDDHHPPFRLEGPRIYREIRPRSPRDISTNPECLPTTVAKGNSKNATEVAMQKVEMCKPSAKSECKSDPIADWGRNSSNPASIKQEAESDTKSECETALRIKVESSLPKVTRNSFADIVDEWKSFTSFSDVPHGFPHPTTLWGDVRSFQSCSQSDRSRLAVDHNGVFPTAPIDLSIPCHQPMTSPNDQLCVPKKSNSRKAKHLSVEGQLQHTQNIHPRDRIRVVNRAERLEASKLWHRLSAPKPDGPLVPEEGFADAAILTAKWGMKLLNLADMVGSGVDKSTRMKKMYRKRRRLRRSNYMQQFGEYMIDRMSYIQTYRRMRGSRPLAAFAADLSHGGRLDAPRSSPTAVDSSLSGLYPPSMQYPTCDYIRFSPTESFARRPIPNQPTSHSTLQPVSLPIKTAPFAQISFDDI